MSRDHENASFIANQLQNLNICLIRPVETNMVWFDVSKYGTMDQLSRIAIESGVCLNGGGSIGRIVIHKDIDKMGINLFMKAMYSFTKLGKC